VVQRTNEWILIFIYLFWDEHINNFNLSSSIEVYLSKAPPKCMNAEAEHSQKGIKFASENHYVWYH
jgi:hypothetical protein